ncbi:phage integrase N-terminal SAM-like domain-containing protein, partial [Ignavibacteria bacterium 4148-Me]|uniref:phage integrase N-terminal SAM-like domain-containing protein n=1 Tax=Rosettibacter primus TaxID=3111523 RepID=UPI00336C1E32
NEMGKDEIQKFINHLAVEQNVSSSTQNQALPAILYLYKNVLDKEVGWLDDIKHATRIKHRIKDIDFNYQQIIFQRY